MKNYIQIGNRLVGPGQPCFVIAEIGINHNGNLETAKRLINTAKLAGCDAVKFQKRTVDIVYSKEELAKPRDSVFGVTNGDLKRGLEFSFEEYQELDNYCKDKNIIWFASCWDEQSVDFIDKFNPPCYKISSASLTDDDLLKHTKSKGKPILISTGMSEMSEIRHAIDILGLDNTIIYHCVSTYPNDNNEINLNVIEQFQKEFGPLIGYSGHERGLTPSVVAVAKGAVSVERHITIDRTLWGSDQAASLEPEGLFRLVRDIRTIPDILGDGVKIVYKKEFPIRAKLRRVKTVHV